MFDIILDYMNAIQERPAYEGQAVHFERLPARQPRFRQLVAPLSPPVQAALEWRGIPQLFEHQAQVRLSQKQSVQEKSAT